MKTIKFPTPNILQWAADNIHKTHPENITITALPQSIAGNPTARLAHGNTDIVIKHLTPAWNITTEVEATKAANSAPGTVQYITHDNNLRVIATQYQQPHNPTWSQKNYLQALETLTMLPEALSSAPISYDVMTKHAGDERRRQKGLTAITANKTTRTLYTEKCRNAIHALNTLPTDNLKPAHTDPYPSNWINTAERPILIDYGTAALAPPGWDIATLTLALPTPPREKTLWAENAGINPEDIQTLAYYMLPTYIEATLNLGTLHAEWGHHMAQRTQEYLTYNP